MNIKLRPASKKRHKGMILTEMEIVDCTDYCPICLSTLQRKKVSRIQQSPPISFLRCTKCNGVSASHMPTLKTIEEIYRDFYLASDEEKFTFHNIQRLAEHIFKDVVIKSDCDIFRILEIGGGDGTLSKEIAKRIHNLNPTVNVKVIEVEMYEGEDFSDESMSIHFTKDLKKVDGFFDLVIASAVLHQIPHLKETLDNLFDHMKDEGIFYASTAFVLPLTRLFGGMIDTLYPLHVHDLGCHFWNSIVKSFSLPGEIVYSRPSLVESQLHRAPLKTLVAHMLKFPAHLELFLSHYKNKNPLWTVVGGWEIFIRFNRTRR